MALPKPLNRIFEPTFLKDERDRPNKYKQNELNVGGVLVNLSLYPDRPEAELIPAMFEVAANFTVRHASVSPEYKYV